MRAIVAILLVLVLGVFANIGFAIFSPAYRAQIRSITGNTSTRIEQSSETSTVTPPSEVQKLSESIEKMAIGLDALALTGSTQTVKVNTGSVAPAAPVTPPPPEKKEYPISALMLTRLMPDVFPKKTENKGIFDIHIFSSLDYTTYIDEKTKVKIYVFAEPYSVMLSNLKLVSGVYAINESDTFFDATFYLNATNKKDTTIRFVTSLEGRAIGLEIPKSLYPKIKKLLTKK